LSSSEFEKIFARLRSILGKHARSLTVTEDRSMRYCLEGRIGPAALRAWGGKIKRPMLPVAWVQIGKAYVSFHLMSLFGNPALRDGMSKKLSARMQGKTCFNFTRNDEALFEELEHLTAAGLAAFKKAGYVTE